MLRNVVLFNLFVVAQILGQTPNQLGSISSGNAIAKDEAMNVCQSYRLSDGPLEILATKINGQCASEMIVNQNNPLRIEIQWDNNEWTTGNSRAIWIWSESEGSPVSNLNYMMTPAKAINGPTTMEVTLGWQETGSYTIRAHTELDVDLDDIKDFDPSTPIPPSTDGIEGSVIATISVRPAGAPLNPTPEPTNPPSPSPTQLPTPSPTKQPSASPTSVPTSSPSAHPTSAPTRSPTSVPTSSPSAHPTPAPTRSPTVAPTTSSPTAHPTSAPTRSPTVAPTTRSPTSSPTALQSPSLAPTRSPTPEDPLACTVFDWRNAVKIDSCGNATGDRVKCLESYEEVGDVEGKLFRVACLPKNDLTCETRRDCVNVDDGKSNKINIPSPESSDDNEWIWILVGLGCLICCIILSVGFYCMNLKQGGLIRQPSQPLLLEATVGKEGVDIEAQDEHRLIPTTSNKPNPSPLDNVNLKSSEPPQKPRRKLSGLRKSSGILIV